jgi:hypothetical protein
LDSQVVAVVTKMRDSLPRSMLSRSPSSTRRQMKLPT